VSRLPHPNPDVLTRSDALAATPGTLVPSARVVLATLVCGTQLAAASAATLAAGEHRHFGEQP
jgi:hypothetical protein